MKRVIAGLVSAGVVLMSLAGTAFAGDPGRYADRASWPSWAATYFRDNAEQNPTPIDGELVDAIRFELLRGYPVPTDDVMNYRDREFRAVTNITRAEFAAILSRSQAIHTEDGSGRDWFVPYVEALKQHGIIPEGASEEWLTPISRREAGQWMGRAADVFQADNNQDGPAFTDVDDPLVQRALRAGIVKGTGGGRFEPDRTLLRVEAAVMLLRLARARNSEGHDGDPQVHRLLEDLIKEADRQHTERMKRWVALGQIDEVETGGILTDEMADAVEYKNRDSAAVRPGASPAWAVNVEERYQFQLLEVHDSMAVIQACGTYKVYRETDPPEKPWFTEDYCERQFLIYRKGKWLLAASAGPVWK